MISSINSRIVSFVATIAALMLWVVESLAQPLEFTEPLTISHSNDSHQFTTSEKSKAIDKVITPANNAVKNHFIHLDSSGRHLIAISGSTVAVVWEDNHSGQPAIYVSYLLPQAKQFTAAQRISGTLPAYEPVIAALTEQRFLAAWEEADRVNLRVISLQGDGPVHMMPDLASRQASVATIADDQAALVWAMKPTAKARDHAIYYADMKIHQLNIKIGNTVNVDMSSDRQTQMYPVLALNRWGSVVVWEDRRQGATRMFTAFKPRHAPFQSFQLLNEFAPPPNPNLGRGSGAMRASLASDRDKIVAAAWMDKRNWRSGYDVYADISHDGGKTFSRDEKVQDMFGNDIPQWHASISLRLQDKVIAVAWDDTRNENPDVFYSLRGKSGWSDDYELPGASGSGDQSHPSIMFDDSGSLHAVWLETSAVGVSLKYTHSR